MKRPGIRPRDASLAVAAAAAIIPLFFNRIAIAFRPLFAKRLGDAGGTDPLVVTREQNEENGETDDSSSVSVTSQNPEGGEK